MQKKRNEALHRRSRKKYVLPGSTTHYKRTSKPDENSAPDFNSTFSNILAKPDENGVTLEQTIIKSLADKASCGDINAIKFLREISGKQEKTTNEIIITVVE